MEKTFKKIDESSTDSLLFDAMCFFFLLKKVRTCFQKYEKDPKYEYIIYMNILRRSKGDVKSFRKSSFALPFEIPSRQIVFTARQTVWIVSFFSCGIEGEANQWCRTDKMWQKD